MIELDGVVNKVETNFGGDSYVLVYGPPKPGATEGPGPLEGVACFTVDKQVYAKYFPGQTVKVRGEVADTVMMPRVIEAEVVSAGPSTAVTIDADQLAAEVAKDPEAAGKKYSAGKYSGKAMLLTGPLVGTKPDTSGDPTGLYLGKADAKVLCIFPGEKSVVDRLKAIKPGDTVKLVGEFSTTASTPTVTQCRLVTGK